LSLGARRKTWSKPRISPVFAGPEFRKQMRLLRALGAEPVQPNDKVLETHDLRTTRRPLRRSVTSGQQLSHRASPKPR
jgi:hypothetical protein